MSVDFSAYLIYGVVLNDEEASKIHEIRYCDDDEIYIYDSIQEKLDKMTCVSWKIIAMMNQMFMF